MLTVDLLLGAPLMSSSIAGYSIIEGARYYGIGNELMGTMIGAMLLGLGLVFADSKLSARMRTIIILAVFAIVFLVIALPPLGAKVGGAIAVVPAMGIALLARRSWRPNARGLAFVALMTVIILGSLFAIDSMRSGAAQSHIGRLIGQAAGGDFSGVIQLMERKFTLNMLLVVTSFWSRLLGLSVVGTLILFIWGKNHNAEKMLSKEESAMAMATCFAAAGAFAFNDSGVLAAATCMVLLWSLMALRVMDPFGGET
ncbi:MAG: hypothetical protein NT018_09645 [Armatimonadetes bacterium]|nr:hypothetical protein [Armatimonadota bacterium]